MVQRPMSSGILSWNDQDEEASEDFHNTLFDSSVNSEGNAVSGFQSSQAVSNRIILSTEFNHQVVELDSSKEAGPLGLTLKKTPSFLNMVEMMLSQEKMNDFVSQPMSEKSKASNLPASFLKIGSWKRIAQHEGDLIVKCYYAKRKLVWEILEMGLKSKIEIQWEDVLAIRATIRDDDDEPGILEIELNQPPLYFRETNPQPRRHTIWHQGSDFTGGQAPKCRRHYVEFPPNTLDKHYQKLLQSDKRLFMLSQGPFPSLKYPYFYPDNGFSFGSRGISLEFPPQHPLSSIPSPSIVPSHHVSSFNPTTRSYIGVMNMGSPMSVIDFSARDERVHSYGFENHRTPLWGQGVNNAVTTLARADQIQSLPSIPSATQTNSDFSCQDYDGFNYGEEAISPPNPNTITLSDIENHLLSDSDDVVCSDERALIARVRSMGSLLEPFEEANPNIDIRPAQENIVQHSRVDGALLLCPQPIRCLPPRVSEEGLMLHLTRNNSSYPYSFSDSKEEDVAAIDGIHGECRWMSR